MQEKSNKKITIVVGELPPQVTGGGEIFIYNLIIELSRRHDIILIGSNDPKIDGIQFFRLSPIKPVRLFYPFQLLNILCKSSRQSEAIYTSYLTASWLVYISITLFSLMFRIPYSFTIHSGELRKWRFKLPYLLFFKNANKITGVSERICKEYQIRTGIQIKYLPPLIPFLSSIQSKDYLRLKYNIPLDKKVILYVGSLKQLKNPIDILKALKILGNEFLIKNNLFVVYAGDGILKEDIIKYAKENNLNHHIMLLGNLPNKDIHETYLFSDVYIICSSYEGTPISLLESMFNGLPILASDAPGINSILKHNETAILFKTNDYIEIASAIQNLLSDSDMQDHIRTNANNYYLKNFNYRNIIEQYIEIIFA